MPKLTDQSYLLNEQYKTDSNLNKRIYLHKRFSTNPYGWCKWVFDQLDLPAGCRLLELGCGVGDLWLENMVRLPSNSQIFLSDYSGGMVHQASENLHDMHQAFSFARIDAQYLPFDDESFDVIVANHMLFHVPDRRKALSQICRVLQPGGKLYATTTGDKHLVEILYLVRQFDPELFHGYSGDPIEFTLENGLALLLEWFPEVRIDRYIDSLCVTEAVPLADYILSSVRLGVAKNKRDLLIEFLNRELISNNGVIWISKDSGIFVAHKPVGNAPVKL
jgi:SAM-dependent methyltransferase